MFGRKPVVPANWADNKEKYWELRARWYERKLRRVQAAKRIEDAASRPVLVGALLVALVAVVSSI